MTLSDVSIERPVLTWMIVIALATFGVLGYQRTGVDQYPEMEMPTISVLASLDGATPEGIEEDVTDVLEEQLFSISGVKTLRSTSLQGAAMLEVEFVLGTDLDVAVQDVRDQVAQAMHFLPKGMEMPTVNRRRTGGMPLMYVPIFSERSVVEISEFVDRVIQPKIESIPGVAAAMVLGDRERNIRIWLDGDAMRARGLAANDVLAALQREHVDRPAGYLEGPGIEWAVKTDAEFRSVEELERMVVRFEDDAPVYLRDVARVEDGEEDYRSIIRFNGTETVAIGIVKQSDANAVDVARLCFARLEEIRRILPPDVRMADRDAILDFSKSIVEAVAETQFALAFGAVLAVFVVFVFLRRSRPTFIIAAAIPLSVIGTFGLVWVAGNTLNTMTLLGLTLAIGVVIDDAIIVLENIERHRESGKSAREAARDGTREITFAAAAATFSVAAVFIPVVFADGFVGAFLSEFGFTVAGSVILSLLVALTLTPMLAARMPPPAPRRPGGVYDRLEAMFTGLETGYRRVLDLSLAHRAATFAVAIASLGLAVVFGRMLGAEFFPPSDGGLVFVQFEAPVGSSLEHTVELLKTNEAVALALPETRGVFSEVGYGGSRGVGMPSAGAVNINMGSPRGRERSTHELMPIIRAKLKEIPGQKVSVVDPFGSMSSSNAMFETQILGSLSLEQLDDLASKMVRELEQRGGFVDVDSNLDLGLPELRVVPDREKAAALGIDAATLAQVIQLTIGGLDVGVFKEEGRRYDIRMKIDDAERRSPSAIDDLYVRGRSGEVVELRNLVRLVPGAAASQISRTDRQRSVTITSNLDGITLAEAVRAAEDVAKRVLPEGVQLAESGEAEFMRESFAQFGLMLVLAILAIYMVLASQFESFLLPLSVMLALPFAMVGALGGLWLASLFGMSGMTFNMFSLIGMILLAGLVTKNSILLVDYANQLHREEGKSPLEAMRIAAPIRMRPVLMTAFSMIFGVLPAALGIGPGSETRAPMAVATAAGMFSSMMLTLLVVPVFYVSLERFSERVRVLARRRGAAREAAVEEGAR
ncbi:MAG: efflux RND transporter permease subunit, partial [Myxococcales bacterium]|nr:efflux RND transporter permease subunit [Myxococcales bacterium]